MSRTNDQSFISRQNAKVRKGQRKLGVFCSKLRVFA